MLAVAALTIVAAVLRFASLSFQSFWFDESVTAHLLGMGFADMLEEIPDSESTPPVYYTLAWVWTQVFGMSDAAIRSLSALAGTLVIPVVYAAGARLVSQRAGLIAAALCAVHPYLIWYSQEARSYSLLVLFSALAFLYFAKAVQDGTGRSAALWAVFSCLALATHYFAGFLVLPEAILLLRLAPRRPALSAVGGVALGSLALTPLVLAQRATGNAAWISDEPARERVELVVKYFTVGRSGEVAVGVRAAAVVLVAMAVALLIREWRRRGGRRGELVVLGVAAGGLGLPALLAIVGLDYFWHQNLIAVLVPLTVLTAAGFAAARPPWLRVAGAAALCALLTGVTLATTYTSSSLHRDDFEGAAEAVGPAEVPRAVIVIPRWCDVTLQRYIPDLGLMRPAGEMVREVVVVATTEDHGCVKSLVPPDAPPPIEGFERSGTERIQNILVLHFESDRARLAVPEKLDLLYQNRWPGSVLFEDPAGADGEPLLR